MSHISVKGSGGSSSSNVQTLTGNSGGAVSPTTNNINVLGGTGITVVGNPGTSTLTISTTGITNLTYVGIAHTDSPYTVLTSDDYISCDVTSGVITAKLPNAPATGKVYIFKDKVGLAATSNITITTVGGSVDIDGATSFAMNTAYESISVIFNGSSYEVY